MTQAATELSSPWLANVAHLCKVTEDYSGRNLNQLIIPKHMLNILCQRMQHIHGFTSSSPVAIGSPW